MAASITKFVLLLVVACVYIFWEYIRTSSRKDKHISRSFWRDTTPIHNKYIMKLFLILQLCLIQHQSTNAFVSRAATFGNRRSELWYNPLEFETAEDKRERMELVRGLQRSFYANETGISPPQHGVFSRLPIWTDDYVSDLKLDAFIPPVF
jgi:hypothetical protein